MKSKSVPRANHGIVLPDCLLAQAESAFWSSGMLHINHWLTSTAVLGCRQTALVCNELLRQFWRCFPLRASSSRERQATKLRDFIDKKAKQLEHMQAAAAPADRPLVAQLLRPLQQALDAAFEAYEVEMRVSERP